MGELLIRLGDITAEQLDAALRQQVVYGARLGTNLIELGYADQDQVARGLSRLHHVPAALARHLSRHDPEALALVPAAVAAEHLAFPVAFSRADGRKLVVCMRDPTDAPAIAALSRAAGLPIVPSVAAELAVLFWLERSYGIARPRRYAYAEPGRTSPLPGDHSDPAQAIGEDDDGIDIDVESDDEADLSGLLQLVDLDHSEVERDHSQYSPHANVGLDMVARTEAPDHYTLRPATPPVTTSAPAPLRVEAPARKSLPKLRLDEAVSAIAGANTREQVLTAVLGYMRTVLGAGLALIVKDALALGQRGFGHALDDRAIETLVVPLSADSFLRTAHDRAQPICAAPASGLLQRRFFKLFGGMAPDQVVVVPVVLRNRVVCMFYGHAHDGGAIDAGTIAKLAQLAGATSEAFVRLITAAKKQD